MSRELIHWEDAVRVRRDGEPPTISRVLLLGEDNPLSVAPEHALYPLPENCSGERLCNLILRMRVQDYMGTWRTNLCVNGRWDKREAGIRVLTLLRDDSPWRTVVMLGRKVASIMEPITGRVPPFGVAWIGDRRSGEDRMRVVALPHPSGRCREWNDPQNFGIARAALLAAESEMPLGEPREHER